MHGPSPAAAQLQQPYPTTPAQALAAAGQPVTLADGATVHLRYSLASLMRMEQRYGSVAGIDRAMKLAKARLEADSPGADPDAPEQPELGMRGVFGVVAHLVAMGLLHEADPRTGRPYGEQRDDDAVTWSVAERMDLGQLQGYMDAFARAFSQAFGPAPQGGGANPPGLTPSSSPGPAGGGSPYTSGTPAPTPSGP